MPPVIRPAPTMSTSSVSFTVAPHPALSPPGRGGGGGCLPADGSRPGGLGDDGGAGGPGLGPEDLELALLPLPHHAGRGNVLALGKPDGAGDGPELGRIQHG